MFTYEDIDRKDAIVKECIKYIDSSSRSIKNNDIHINNFIFLYLAKLENENKKLREMITGEHEVMT